MGGPKALIRRHPNDPTLVESAVRLLHDGGCAGVTVVVGAAGQEVTAIVTALGRDIDVVTCHDWDEGMGASLRSGLTALARASHEGEARVDAVLVTLVDLPDLTPAVVARVLDVPRQEDEPALRRVLRRAAYDHHRGTRRSSGASTGRASSRRPSATTAPGTTTARTRTSSSSAATSRRDATPTPRATSTRPAEKALRFRQARFISDAQGMDHLFTSADDVTAALGGTGYLGDDALATVDLPRAARCSGRCCSRASPAPARPRWPRRSPRRSTCR